MIIAYYRNKEGRIISFQTVGGMSKEIATMAAEDFNKKNSEMATATIVEVEEDSLEAYLVEKAEEKYKVMRNTKEDIISALQDAIDYIEGLEVVDG